MQIRQLGGTAGLTLFGKLGKKIHLTQAGSDFFRYS
jgi:DNA-binding transcriptional LysR family regulator